MSCGPAMVYVTLAGPSVHLGLFSRSESCRARRRIRGFPFSPINETVAVKRGVNSGCKTGMKLLICFILALASLAAGSHTPRYGTRSRIGTAFRKLSEIGE